MDTINEVKKQLFQQEMKQLLDRYKKGGFDREAKEVMKEIEKQKSYKEKVSQAKSDKNYLKVAELWLLEHPTNTIIIGFCYLLIMALCGVGIYLNHQVGEGDTFWNLVQFWTVPVLLVVVVPTIYRRVLPTGVFRSVYYQFMWGWCIAALVALVVADKIQMNGYKQVMSSMDIFFNMFMMWMIIFLTLSFWFVIICDED